MPRDSARTRARAIVERLRAENGSEDPFLDFEDLDALPPEVVREALEPWLGAQPDVDRLDDAIRTRHGMPPRALRLETIAVVEDADVLDLGAVAEKQLRIAGKTWDGADLEPEERLDGELEGTFAGTLRHVVLADAESKMPLFDVIRFHEDQAVVFRAGTIDVVAFLADGVVETRDRRLRPSLADALRTTTEPPAAKKSARAKKSATKTKKTAAAKKAAPKKKTSKLS